MPTKVDDGDAKILRVEMEDKVVAEIMLPPSIIDDETRHVITNMLDCVELSGESTGRALHCQTNNHLQQNILGIF